MSFVSRFQRFLRLSFIVALAAGGLLGAVARAADGGLAALETFSGEWEGELRVYALDGFLLKTFPARRYYSWNDAAQVVVTRFFDGSSDYETQATQLTDVGRLSATVLRPGQPPEEYAGAVEAGALVWTNASNNKRDYTERLVTTNGVTRLETTSSEIMRVKGVSGVVRVTGSFQRNGAARSSVAAPVLPGATALEKRIATLERALADARQAATAAAQSGAATQSDLAREREALRARLTELETERTELANRAAEATAAAVRIAELEQLAAETRRANEAARIAAAAESGHTIQLRDRVSALEAQLREAEGALTTARAGAADSTGQKQVLAQRDAELAELRTRFERSASDLVALQHQLEQVRADQTAAATKAAAAEARANAADTDTKVRLADLQGQLQTARSAREQATADAAKLTEQLATLRADAEKMRSGASVESMRIQQLERDLAAAQEAGRKHDTIARELQMDLAKAEMRAATAEAARRSATTVSGEAEREQAALREQVTKLQRELDAAHSTRTQQEDDNTATSAALDAARAETARLSARVNELESTVSSAEQARQATAAVAGSVERERADLRHQIASLISAAETASTDLATLQSDRDSLSARVTALAARPDISAGALAAERRQAQERLERAESAARDAAVRLADTEKELADTRATATQVVTTAAGLDELRRELAAAQAETAATRQQAELLQSERDLLAFRIKGTDEALTEHQAALQAGETAVADARRRADSAEARLQQLENASAATAGLRAELAAQRTHDAEREQENIRLNEQLAALDRERTALNARVAELERPTTFEPAAPAFSLASSSAASGARTELQTELNRLQRRVTELESERNSIRDTQTFLQGQLDQTRQLRDDTLARFQDVVAQLNAMREERDRLARANVSLQSESRAGRGTGAAPVTAAAPVAGSSPSFLDRLLGNSEAPKPAAPPAPALADDDLPPASTAIEEKVAALQVIGITRGVDEDKVILNGRLFRTGDIIDPSASIVFERIDGDALIFSDANGREYRRRF